MLFLLTWTFCLLLHLTKKMQCANDIIVYICSKWMSFPSLFSFMPLKTFKNMSFPDSNRKHSKRSQPANQAGHSHICVCVKLVDMTNQFPYSRQPASYLLCQNSHFGISYWLPFFIYINLNQSCESCDFLSFSKNPTCITCLHIVKYRQTEAMPHKQLSSDSNFRHIRHDLKHMYHTYCMLSSILNSPFWKYGCQWKQSKQKEKSFLFNWDLLSRLILMLIRWLHEINVTK